MSTPKVSYRQFILNELTIRQSRNRHYSMGAFARDLGISGSRLSEILNGKVGLSQSRAITFADKMSLNEKEKSYFLDLVLAEHARSPLVRSMSLERVKNLTIDFKLAADDQIKFIDDFLPSAVLESLHIQQLEQNSEKIAKFLNCSKEQIEQLILRLAEHGAIKKDEKGQWVQTDNQRPTSTGIPAAAIRENLSILLEKAQTALESQELYQRDFSSIIFALNKSQLDYAKERIKNFRHELMKELEVNPDKDSIYCLSMQLFEVSKT